MLKVKKKNKGFVFADWNGSFYEENKPRRALRKIRSKAGLGIVDGRRIGWHALRHTFASHLAMRGVSLPTIKKLLGHSNIQTTMQYSHLSPSVLEQAVELMDMDSENENFGHYMGTEQSNTEKKQAEINNVISEISLRTKQKQGLPTLFKHSGDGGS
ncbi:MAG: tyrosine-type recombinase/integrase, partial [Patescibacteria group bacterium]|nr:tyrosine-type recombinase/integrase [Patescibacteria group bacterium]